MRNTKYKTLNSKQIRILQFLNSPNYLDIRILYLNVVEDLVLRI